MSVAEIVPFRRWRARHTDGRLCHRGRAGDVLHRAIPNTFGLGLENVGLHGTPHGAIDVDAYSKSKVDSIYAVGDVTNRVNLTPVAIREGHAFADRRVRQQADDGEPLPHPHGSVLAAGLGTVGLTEAQARSGHARVDIYKTSFRPMKHTLSGRDERM